MWRALDVESSEPEVGRTCGVLDCSTDVGEVDGYDAQRKGTRIGPIAWTRLHHMCVHSGSWRVELPQRYSNSSSSNTFLLAAELVISAKLPMPTYNAITTHIEHAIAFEFVMECNSASPSVALSPPSSSRSWAPPPDGSMRGVDA